MYFSVIWTQIVYRKDVAMTDPTPQRNQLPRDDRPVMGDHPELEDEDAQVEPLSTEEVSNLRRLLLPGIVVLAIALIVILYFVFLD